MANPSELAIELMTDFAHRTGLTSDAAPRRYLWTDAFAVVNWLELHRSSGEESFCDLAKRLIDQVHEVLGRHRSDDPRSGWLSGLPEDEGRVHPTAGGLRIGKPFPERGPGEPYDERLEWDRDGQYFHYLTKWMDALARAARRLRQPRYWRLAIELAEAVYPRFLLRTPAGEIGGLAWKMSVDLSRPLTSGSSPHDALDGYVTFSWLEAGRDNEMDDLSQEMAVLRRLSDDRTWATGDPLGLGGLLLDAFRLLLISEAADDELIVRVLAGAAVGLAHYERQPDLHAGPSRRLAFRELGLAIGLQALPAIADHARRRARLVAEAGEFLERLRSSAGVGERIVRFWAEPANRENSTWRDHRDINDVMLATALLEAQPRTAEAPG